MTATNERTNKRTTIKGYALLFAGMATVGVYVALSKPLVAVMPVFLLATLRFAIAAVIMLPWLRAEPAAPALNRDDRWALFVQSLFGNFLFSICMLYGVSMTSAASAGVILSALPAVVALLSWWALRERLGVRGWLAVALAVSAVALLTWLQPSVPFASLDSGAGARTGACASAPRVAAPAGQPDARLALWGNLLVMACVICEAVYVILGKRLSTRLSARRNSALLNGIGLLLMLPLGLWQARSFDFATMTPALWGLLLFYSLAASVISTWLWLSGLKWVPAAHSGVFTIALPIASTGVGALVLGEAVGWPHVLALGLAATGIVLITRDRYQSGAVAATDRP